MATKDKWHIASPMSNQDVSNMGYGDPWQQNPVQEFDQQNFRGPQANDLQHLTPNELHQMLMTGQIDKQMYDELMAQAQNSPMGLNAEVGTYGKRAKWHVAMGGACPNCQSPMVGPNCPGCGYADQMGATDGNYHNPGTGLSPQEHLPSAMASKKSKWHVVALGEVQQPTAVAAPSMEPESDPNYLPMDDVSNMSFEQEVAFERWVNTAVDMLNKGIPPQEILAELAHEGCDDPQMALLRAQEQPLNADGNLQDPPPQEQPMQQDPNTGSGEAMSQPPPFQAKVIGTQVTGRVTDQYTDMYDRSISRIVTATGTHEVLTDQLEPIDTVDVDPINAVHELLDGMPPLEDNKASVEARIANLKMAAEMCRKAHYAKNITEDQQVAIAKIEDNTRVAVLNLTDKLHKYKPSLDEYLASQPKFAYDAYGLEEMYTKEANVSTSAYDKVMDEHPILVVNDLTPVERLDPMTVRRHASEHISQYVWELPPRTRREMTEQFVEAALEVARNEQPEPDWTPKTASVQENITDYDGPAASIFF